MLPGYGGMTANLPLICLGYFWTALGRYSILNIRTTELIGGMFALTFYGILRFLHVVLAIVAMGPHFASIFIWRHINKNPESARSFMPVLATLAKFPKHGGMAMLLTGVLMVAVSGSGFAMFKELWLALSLVLFIANVVLGAARMEPAAKVLGMSLAQGPVKPEQFAGMMAKVSGTSRLMTAILVAIIVLMVFRPTL